MRITQLISQCNMMENLFDLELRGVIFLWMYFLICSADFELDRSLPVVTLCFLRDKSWEPFPIQCIFLLAKIFCYTLFFSHSKFYLV